MTIQYWYWYSCGIVTGILGSIAVWAIAMLLSYRSFEKERKLVADEWKKLRGF